MKKYILVFILFFLILPVSVPAEDKISVAVSDHFISAFKEIAADFEETTGVKVQATFSSAGNLYNRIKNGVSYDVFLSSDEKQPDLLQKEGFSEGSFIYAHNRIVLWSAREDFCKAANWRDALQDQRIKKIAIADPLTTSHGFTTKTALQKAELWEALQGKLVNSRNTDQSFLDAASRRVDAGFGSLSALPSLQGIRGCHYEIPEAPAILMAGCILKNAKNKICAELFMVYMLSDRPVPIKKKYGYR